MERYIVDLFSNDNTGFLKKPIATKTTATKTTATKKPSNNLVKELEINQVAGGESVNNSQCSASPTQCVDSYASCSQTGGR